MTTPTLPEPTFWEDWDTSRFTHAFNRVIHWLSPDLSFNYGDRTFEGIEELREYWTQTLALEPRTANPGGHIGQGGVKLRYWTIDHQTLEENFVYKDGKVISGWATLSS